MNGVIRMLKLSSILLLVSSISSCQYDPYAGNLTTEKPRINDIVGTYKFREQTVTRKPISIKAKSATITLYLNGKFEVTNLPNLRDQDGVGENNIISTEGKWKIETVSEVDDGNGSKEAWGVVLDSLPQSLSTIGLIGNSPPYKLIITFGDPDSGEVMILSKR